MRLLIDTNVILDFLLGRKGFFDDAKKIIDLASRDETIEFVTASSVTDIFYLCSKEVGKDIARSKLIDLLNIMTVLKVENQDIQNALNLKEWTDFEDAVQYTVALHNSVDMIITRNSSDYKHSSIPVYEPKTFLHLLGS